MQFLADVSPGVPECKRARFQEPSPGGPPPGSLRGRRPRDDGGRGPGGLRRRCLHRPRPAPPGEAGPRLPALGQPSQHAERRRGAAPQAGPLPRRDGTGAPSWSWTSPAPASTPSRSPVKRILDAPSWPTAAPAWSWSSTTWTSRPADWVIDLGPGAGRRRGSDRGPGHAGALRERGKGATAEALRAARDRQARPRAVERSAASPRSARRPAGPGAQPAGGLAASCRWASWSV
jgi:hypothetical protein